MTPKTAFRMRVHGRHCALRQGMLSAAGVCERRSDSGQQAGDFVANARIVAIVPLADRHPIRSKVPQVSEK